jgi:SAM-dependent methyltransferase
MEPHAMIPHGLALLAYVRGEASAPLIIRRDDGVEATLRASHFFRPPAEFSPLEVAALERCRGHVLDIGAGTGLRSLALLSRGRAVTAVDISAQAVEIMARRGVPGVHCADIFEFQEGAFDTLLMLGHGIGMVEDLQGLSRFLAHAHRLTRAGGHVRLDSRDVRQTDDPRHLAYHEANRRDGRYCGEIRQQLEYAGQTGPYGGWLHVDPEPLRQQGELAGWQYETILEQHSSDRLAGLASMRAA